MKRLKRHQLQSIITRLYNQGKLERPLSEVLALPNWYLVRVINYRK